MTTWHRRHALGCILVLAACGSKNADPPASTAADPKVAAPPAPPAAAPSPSTTPAAPSAPVAAPTEPPSPAPVATKALRLGGPGRTAAMELSVPAGFSLVRDDDSNYDDLSVDIHGPGLTVKVDLPDGFHPLAEAVASATADGARTVRQEERPDGWLFVSSQDGAFHVERARRDLRASCSADAPDLAAADRVITICDTLRYTGAGPATATPPDAAHLLKALRATKIYLPAGGDAMTCEGAETLPALLKAWTKELTVAGHAPTLDSSCQPHPGGPFQCTTVLSANGMTRVIAYMVAANGTFLDLLGCRAGA